MSIDRQLGSFEVHEILGWGGMGTVYLARHPELAFELAIKTLVTGRGATPVQRKRFQRAEKKAMQAPVLMLIPLVLFIFPLVFMIIFTPIALRVMDAM